MDVSPPRRLKRSALVTHPAVRLSLGLACVIGLYLYLVFAGVEAPDPLSVSGTFHPSGPLDLSEGGRARKIVPLTSTDRYHLRRQRAIVDELARRHVGTPISGGSADDLRVLQELLDQRVLKPDETYELQALGVVLGDVMAGRLGLSWVRLEDNLGRSRALRLDETAVLLFPVTMISRRVEAEIQFTVRELYEHARGVVAQAGAPRV